MKSPEWWIIILWFDNNYPSIIIYYLPIYYYSFAKFYYELRFYEVHFVKLWLITHLVCFTNLDFWKTEINIFIRTNNFTISYHLRINNLDWCTDIQMYLWVDILSIQLLYTYLNQYATDTDTVFDNNFQVIFSVCLSIFKDAMILIVF